jgi:hypothetical protein
MTLTPDQRIAAIGVSVGLLLPAFPALWKAAGLRGDTNNTWAARVDLTYAGLTERAIEVLRELQAQADQLLGDMSDFDPALVVVDPAPLAGQAGRFSRLLRVRKCLRSRFQRQLFLMSLTVYLVGGYAIGIILAGSYYCNLQSAYWTGWAGIALSGVSLALGAILLVQYTYLEAKLSGAEIMAAPTIP